MENLMLKITMGFEDTISTVEEKGETLGVYINDTCMTLEYLRFLKYRV